MLALLLCSLVVSGHARAQRLHTVLPGETLSSIARRHRLRAADLAAANGMAPSRPLREGETLELPPQGVTYVRAGQTLSQIARTHDCTVAELQRLNRLRPSAQLREGAMLKLPGFAPAEVVERDWGPPAQPGSVTFTAEAGAVQVELVDSAGRVRLKGLRALADAMHRDTQIESRHVHPRLAVLIAKVSDHFGGRPITVISGFREAGGRTTGTSRHVAGRAADIQVAGVPARLLWDYCRSLAQTGCGLYPNSVFVHLDVREQPAQWIDWSRPGKRARYGTLRRAYRRNERKSPTRERVTRKITAPDEVPLAVVVVNRTNDVVHAVDESQTPTAEPDAGAADDGEGEGAEQEPTTLQP